MPSLAAQGAFLTSLSLVGCDLVCGRTLDPWSRSCPNLRRLTVAACEVAQAELFVGDLPQLHEEPFPGKPFIVQWEPILPST